MSPAAGGPETRVMTTSEVAKWLSLSEPTIIQHVQKGLIPASRIGAEWRYWRPLMITRLFPEVGPVPDDADPDTDVITIEELARRLHLSVPTVRMRIEDRSIPASRVGKTWRIYWPTIRDRLAAGEDFTPPVAE